MKHFLRPATIIGALPNNIQNGQVEDAVPVMANYNWIVNQVNANAAQLSLTPQLASANIFTNGQTIAAGTTTVNNPAFAITQTWDSASATFSGFTINITNTNSAAASKVFDFQVGGISRFTGDRLGNLAASGSISLAGNIAMSGYPQSWTPTDASGAGLSLTVVANGCFHYKIGGLAFVFFDLAYPVTADGATALIGGLPFLSRNSTNDVGSGGFSLSGGGVVLFIDVLKNSNTLQWRKANNTPAINSDISNTTLRGHIVYPLP